MINTGKQKIFMEWALQHHIHQSKKAKFACWLGTIKRTFLNERSRIFHQCIIARGERDLIIGRHVEASWYLYKSWWKPQRAAEKSEIHEIVTCYEPSH